MGGCGAEGAGNRHHALCLISGFLFLVTKPQLSLVSPLCFQHRLPKAQDRPRQAPLKTISDAQLLSTAFIQGLCLFQAIFWLYSSPYYPEVLWPTHHTPAWSHLCGVPAHTLPASLSISTVLGPLRAGNALRGAAEGTVLLSSPSREGEQNRGLFWDVSRLLLG